RHGYSPSHGLDLYGHSAATVTHRIFHQVSQDLVNLVLVKPHFGEIVTHDEAETALLLARRDPPVDDAARPGGNVDDLAAHLQAAGLDAGDVEQLGDEPGDPVGVVVDRFEHDELLLFGEAAPLGQQRRGETLDAGQRRAQLVGDRRDQVGAAALQPGAGTAVAQRDRHAVDVAAPLGLAHQPRGHVHLLAAGQVERLLRHAAAGAQAALGVERLPPVAAVVVAEREHLVHVAADGALGLDAGEAGGGAVDGEHPAEPAGDDEPVGKVVDRYRARGGHQPPVGVCAVHDLASSAFKADNSGFPA